MSYVSGTSTGHVYKWWKPCLLLRWPPQFPLPWSIFPTTVNRWDRTTMRNILYRFVWLFLLVKTLIPLILDQTVFWCDELNQTQIWTLFLYSSSVLMGNIIPWQRPSSTHLSGVWGVCSITLQVCPCVDVNGCEWGRLCLCVFYQMYRFFSIETNVGCNALLFLKWCAVSAYCSVFLHFGWVDKNLSWFRGTCWMQAHKQVQTFLRKAAIDRLHKAMRVRLVHSHYKV